MLTLRGAPALSAFSSQKLLQTIQTAHPAIKAVHTYFYHFVDVSEDFSAQEMAILERLLTYGPRQDDAFDPAAGDFTL